MQKENGYRLEETTLSPDWDKFVSCSEAGTVFSYSDFLNALTGNFKPYYVFHKTELRAALLLVMTNDGKGVSSHDYVIYNGILFGPPAFRQNHDQVLSERFDIFSYVANELTSRFNKIEFALHPSVIDIRPLLWVNYATDLPKYKIDILYTSYLNIGDFACAESLEDISIYSKASKSRRQEIRYAIRKNVKTVEEYNAARFVDFYARTMARQGIKVPQSTLSEMYALLENTNVKGIGRMFVSYTANGRAGSMAYFCTDTKRAYYVFGANDPDLRDEHTGTAVLWDAFKSLAMTGVSEVDMEGINSPKRGWFKLSFGGEIVPYYKATFKREGQ